VHWKTKFPIPSMGCHVRFWVSWDGIHNNKWKVISIRNTKRKLFLANSKVTWKGPIATKKKKKEEFVEHTFMSNYFNPFCNFRLPTHKALGQFFQKNKTFGSLHKIMPLEGGVHEGHIFHEHPIPRPLFCVKNQKLLDISAPISGSLIWGTPPLSGHYPTHYLCACPAILGGKAW
jgi:hypothetical protein